MAACISPRPFTAETLAFDRSWADITPSGTVVHAADVAARPHQPYSSSSATSSTLAESEPGRLNDRTSWFSAKTAVWDPRVLLNTVKGPDADYTLHKAIEWGTKCNSDLSDDEKVDNVLRFLAHAVGLQSAISANSLQNSSTRTSHSRSDSTWSSLSEISLSTSPNSDSASLIDFRCDTPVMGSRRSGSPSPSVRSYCMAETDEDDREPLSIQSSVVLPSLSNSLCFSDASERDRAMEELREIVRSAIVAVEADDDGPLGLAELHAAARNISYAHHSSEENVTAPPTEAQPKTPPAVVHLKEATSDTAALDSPTFTPQSRPVSLPRLSRPSSPTLSENPSNALLPPGPVTPRSKVGKLYKPRPVLPNDPIPLQTFRTISSPSPTSSPTLSTTLDPCRSQTPRAPESPTWSQGLLKPFGLRLDVHMLTDAISGLGIRKPMSPPTARESSPAFCSMGLPEIPSPVDSPVERPGHPASPTEKTAAAQMMKRCSSGGSEWQYLRHQSGDTDDTPVLATPIDEWYLPQLTPATEYSDWKGVAESK